MIFNKLQRKALKIIFGDPKIDYGYNQSETHAQKVLNSIFVTQTKFLGIKRDVGRESIIEDDAIKWVKELRYGTQIADDYKVSPVDERLIDDTKENNEFWEEVQNLLVDAILWNYQSEIIIESWKQRFLTMFYNDPKKFLPEHVNYFKKLFLSSMKTDEEKRAFNNEFLEIEAWAKQKDMEFQVPHYPIKSSIASLLITLVGYGCDTISSYTAVALAATELSGTYLWGQYVPGRRELTYKECNDGMYNAYNTFLKLNKLKPVKITGGNTEIIYTKFNGKMPTNATNFDDSQFLESDNKQKMPSKKTRDINEKKGNGQQVQEKRAKKRETLAKSTVEDKANIDATTWELPSRDDAHRIISTQDKKHVVPACGNYAQPNTYTYLDKSSKSIQDFRQTYGEPKNKEAKKDEKKDASTRPCIYKLFKPLVREAHFVSQIGKQGIKRLEKPIYIHGVLYTWEAKHKGVEASNLRFFGRDVKAKNGATLVVFDEAGPALHRG